LIKPVCGGKGVIGMTTRETTALEGEPEDFIEHLFTASTHDYLMFFTNTGRVYVERVHEIPDMGRAAKGRSIANLLELQAGEKIAALIRVIAKTGPNKEDITWGQTDYVFFATQLGTVKKTNLAEFANVRKGGIIAEQVAVFLHQRPTTGGVHHYPLGACGLEHSDVVPGQLMRAVAFPGMGLQSAAAALR
jgi:DNA gyrase/topoisomerase IV subunit A